MTKLYQLMIGGRQVNDLYYDRDDAIENAKQLVRDTGKPVSVWVAEDVEGVPVDELDWTTLTTVRLFKYMVWDGKRWDRRQPVFCYDGRTRR